MVWGLMLFVIINGIGTDVNPCKAKQLFAENQFTLFVLMTVNLLVAQYHTISLYSGIYKLTVHYLKTRHS